MDKPGCRPSKMDERWEVRVRERENERNITMRGRERFDLETREGNSVGEAVEGAG